MSCRECGGAFDHVSPRGLCAHCEYSDVRSQEREILELRSALRVIGDGSCIRWLQDRGADQDIAEARDFPPIFSSLAWLRMAVARRSLGLTPVMRKRFDIALQTSAAPNRQRTEA